MGGDLTAAPEGAAPSFLVRAVKDPDGANLDRVQVVKGWRDSATERRASACTTWRFPMAGRRARTARSAQPVGNTVDVGNATYLNSASARPN